MTIKTFVESPGAYERQLAAAPPVRKKRAAPPPPPEPIRTPGRYTILGRTDDGKLRPLLNLREFDTLEEAESEARRYQGRDKAVQFLVFQFISEIPR